MTHGTKRDAEHHYEQALYHLEQIDDRDVTDECFARLEDAYGALDDVYPIEFEEGGA